eukprot:m.305639 g.305639  ORF g.305639 m.305639 type:complete len:274 (-) comp20185_c0_seq1:2234-3055(-)
MHKTKNIFVEQTINYGLRVQTHSSGHLWTIACKMVDYSKFEQIVLSDDDEDVSDDRGDPGVYRIGDGESFTVPGRNVTFKSNKPGYDNSASSSNLSAAPKPQKKVVDTTHGALETDYFWSQCKESVTLGVFVASGTKAGDIGITVTNSTVSVRVKENTVVDKELFSEVDSPLEAEDLDWEILDDPDHEPRRRFVRVTLFKKHALGPRVIMWWKCFFKGDPQIDVDSIEERKKDQSASKFMEAYKEAQEMFKAKMANKVVDSRIEVDIGDDDDT